MTGHGAKFGRNKEDAIVALLKVWQIVVVNSDGSRTEGRKVTWSPPAPSNRPAWTRYRYYETTGPCWFCAIGGKETSGCAAIQEPEGSAGAAEPSSDGASPHSRSQEVSRKVFHLRVSD
jgi:hypothetical protein